VLVALDIHHEMRTRHIVICGPSGSTLFFPLYFIKGTISGTKVTGYKTRVLIFSTTLSEAFLIIRRNERDFINNEYWSSSKVPVMFVMF